MERCIVPDTLLSARSARLQQRNEQEGGGGGAEHVSRRVQESTVSRDASELGPSYLTGSTDESCHSRTSSSSLRG